MKKIALTGNMGSGKSYVGKIIAQCNVFVLDMDKVAKQVRKEQSEELLRMFACQNTQELAQLVFSDETKRAALETFLYPLMLAKMQAFFIAHQKEKLCVVEVPLLFEKQWEVYFDEVWCVSCDEKEALQRLCQYRHIPEKEARKRWSKQMSMAEKVERSQHIIYNNRGDDVEKQVKALLKGEEYDVEKR
ncbi:MAG: dephospho-CoA kinase [Erysipelotrichia bacterium]|nr:dephospho-CoA kinase [Erysipelotrichia bacterium]NCC55505.1 dephospho-CoA kinase [Erysipelotrichia bacterium]